MRLGGDGITIYYINPVCLSGENWQKEEPKYVAWNMEENILLPNQPQPPTPEF